MDEGERYWLDDSETEVLIEENERFQRVNALVEMIAETFGEPAHDDDGHWWTLGEIAACLQQRYRSQDTRTLSIRSIGKVMNYPRFHFSSKRRAQGMVYWLAERPAMPSR